MKKTISEILKEVTMFASLKSSEITLLSSISHMHDYKKGSTLFMEGEISDSLILLVDGVVSLFKHDSKGNEIILGYFTPFALLAEPATLRHTTLPSTSTFKTDGTIIKINLEKFEELFMDYPNISRGIIQSLLKKIDLLQQNIHFNIASTSSEKILHFYKKNPELSLDLKKYEIASILGITSETFSRNITKLIKENRLEKISTGYRLI
jgi:CRP/FNR family transcriptional regulator